MRIPRKRIAQAAAAVASAAMFGPWHTVATEAGAESVRGVAVSEGQLVLVAGLVTVGLVQAGWRPAWIGAGLAVATTVRAILDGGADPAAGLWTAAAASAAAVVLLVWDLFASVSATGDSATGDSGGPGGRGLSGPLGRRRR